MIWRAILRIILVPMGFMLALGAALFVLFTLGQERIVHEISGGFAGDDWIDIATRRTRSLTSPSNMSC